MRSVQYSCEVPGSSSHPMAIDARNPVAMPARCAQSWRRRAGSPSANGVSLHPPHRPMANPPQNRRSVVSPSRQTATRMMLIWPLAIVSQNGLRITRAMVQHGRWNATRRAFPIGAVGSRSRRRARRQHRVTAAQDSAVMTSHAPCSVMGAIHERIRAANGG